MPIDFTNTLVVGISASALFDLTEADRVFREQGIKAYRSYMLEREEVPLKPGCGFPLVRALLLLNKQSHDGGMPLTEVVVMSRNSTETGVRVFRSLNHHGLAITRFAFTGGEPLAPYVSAFSLDLFLSTTKTDVQAVVDAGSCAAALLSPPPAGYTPPDNQVRVAFDADAVLFSEESEVRYKREGLPAFHSYEKAFKDEPLPDGPFANFMRKLAKIKASLPEQTEYSPIRIAVVTARNAPAEERVITTFRKWNVYVDEAFFLGGIAKDKVLAGFRPHIFFDDQDLHVIPASQLVPAARVPYRSQSTLNGAIVAEVVPLDGDVPMNRSPADSVTPVIQGCPPGRPSGGDETLERADIREIVAAKEGGEPTGPRTAEEQALESRT